MHLLTAKEMYEADRLTIQSGITGCQLMSQAGKFVADAIENLNIGPCKTVVLAGTGNNGGDAFVAAELLNNRNYHVELYLSGEQKDLGGDAALMAKRYSGKIKETKSIDLNGVDLIIDGLIGAGLDRPVKDELAQLILKVNASKIPVVAVDIPSGVSSDTGKVMGVAIMATKTVTFFRPKPGHFLYPGRAHCGNLQCRDIGIQPRVLKNISPKTALNTKEVWQSAFSSSQPTIHKYNKGCAIVLAGDNLMNGASSLSANAALRAGAGLVIYAATEETSNPHPKLSQAVMKENVGRETSLADLINKRRINAALIGPGWPVNISTREKTLELLECPANIIIDAGAVSSFEEQPNELIKKLANSGNIKDIIITPHEAEFKRLFGNLIEQHGKLLAAKIAAEQSQSCIILKGADTVIADKDGRVVINQNAPSSLATAGTGDVLAGIVTGFIANQLPAFEAASAAVFIHAECAASIGSNLISDDLLVRLSDEIRKLS